MRSFLIMNYRKRIRLFPGVTINLSGRGYSLTVGSKLGVSFNFSKLGVYMNTFIPGTGLYKRKKIL